MKSYRSNFYFTPLSDLMIALMHSLLFRLYDFDGKPSLFSDSISVDLPCFKSPYSFSKKHVRKASPFSCHNFLFLCPQRNFGRHIVITLSFRPSVLQSVRPSRFRVRSISPIFFEVGIPNLVCGYILGWRSVVYHFRVTLTLT